MRYVPILALVSCVFWHGGSLAACLLDDYSVAVEYRRAEAVIIAKAVARRDIADRDGPTGIGGTIYSVSISESFRGTRHGDIEVFSENSSGRFPMEIGQSYLLFLYRDSAWLAADNCGNSGKVQSRRPAIAEIRHLAAGH